MNNNNKKISSRRAETVHLLNRPTVPYYLLLFSVFFLTGLGLVMVLSASSVKSLEQSGNSYAVFLKQLLFLVVASLFAFIASRMPPQSWLAIAKVAIFASAAFLILPQIHGIGKTINGNTNWIGFGPFTIQPSDFAKFGLILYCSLQLKRYEERADGERPLNPIGLLLPGVLTVLILIMLGRDLGTALIVMAIAGSMLFICGLRFRHFILIALISGVAVTALAITHPNRRTRFVAFLDPFSQHFYKDAGWQTAHSIMGLASGGLFGVGLGASRQKWGNLSEANTDFIFSVIGEEMGLVGTLLVLALYAILIYAIFRISVQTKDIFSRYVCAGIACWLMVQVAVNLGSDIGVFPVIGVTLPFISYGGSALVANFIGIGFVANVARREPEVRKYLQDQKLSSKSKSSGTAS